MRAVSGLTNGRALSRVRACRTRGRARAARAETDWTVSVGDEEAMSAIAELQTRCFFEPMGGLASPLNGMMEQQLRAELRDGLRRKSEYTHLSRFAALTVSDGSAVVGVVELSVQNNAAVLAELLSGTPALGTKGEYCYLASMAVDPERRRLGMASALIAAAEELARVWGFEGVALHSYTENAPAVSLYERCGYSVLAEDVHGGFAEAIPIGGKKRLLMAKQISLSEAALDGAT
mmetsp:Transcript_20224/g.65832  ORF Transcript_20224/g.65832 Transcript_20224/m.65832 type:complete len:234 (+) Transcript_20224:39-740(+)